MKSKKKKLLMWNHEFVCLANKDEDKTPTSYERSSLISAGMLSSRLFLCMRKSLGCAFSCMLGIFHAPNSDDVSVGETTLSCATSITCALTEGTVFSFPPLQVLVKRVFLKMQIVMKSSWINSLS